MSLTIISVRGPAAQAAASCLLFLVALMPVAPALGGGNSSNMEIGSGDGRIHVIPSLAPYSIKNGETLSVSAVVRSAEPVSSVQANLGGLASITLEPDPRRGGVSTDGTTGIWSAEWVGQDLEQRVYAVTLTVTDAEGHSFTDHTLTFSDPAAGHTSLGTTDYPAGGMRRMDSKVLLNERHPNAAVIDTQSGYAYFGLGTTPGRIVKVVIGDGKGYPRRVGSVTLAPGENKISCGVIDTANGYAYFGTDTAPARVIKILLGEGDDPPRRVTGRMLFTIVPADPFPLIVFHNHARSAAIDPDNGYAYFGTGTTPGRVVKVNLGEGDMSPWTAGFLDLAPGENNLTAAVMDPVNGYAYFGTHPDMLPAHVVKVAVGDGSTPMHRIGSVALEYQVTMPGGTVIGMFDGPPGCGVIDPARGQAWFGINGINGRVVKISLGAGAAPPVRLNAVGLMAGEGHLRSAVMDPAGAHAYFGTGTGHGDDVSRVVKVSLGVGDARPDRVGAVTLDSVSELYLDSAVIDLQTGHAYFGANGAQESRGASIVQIGLGAGSDPPSRINRALLASTVGAASGNETQLTSAVRNPETGQLFFGTNSMPGRIVKLDTGGAQCPPTRHSAAAYVAPGGLFSGVFDPVLGCLFFGSADSPGQVSKYTPGLAALAPQRIGHVELDPGEAGLWGAVVDPENGYAYFGTNTSPGQVIKVSLGDSVVEWPTRVGAVTLESGENYLSCAVIDTENGHAYFGTYTNPGRVVKIALGDGDNPPTRLGAATMEYSRYIPDLGWTTTQESYLSCAAIDIERGHAYFGTDTVPGKVGMVALGQGENPPSRIGARTLDAGEDWLRSAVFDPERGHLYFGTNTTPGRIVKLARGPNSSPPVRLGALELPEGEDALVSAAIDPEGGYAYFGTAEASTPGSVVRIALGHKNFLHGMRIDIPEDAIIEEVLFYTYASGGSFRLAIYDDGEPKQRLWQSASLPAHPSGGENGVTIAGGTPSSLLLPAGTYWAAWQVDTNEPTASYTPGSEGDGFVVPLDYGAAPPTIPYWRVTSTSDLWTLSLAYNPASFMPGDFNYDGCVNFQDFIIMLENWGQEYMGTTMDFTAFIALLENWGVGC